MCQRVKRYLQKRLVELRDVYDDQAAVDLLTVPEAAVILAQIREIEAVLAVMNESPLRVIEAEAEMPAAES